MTDNVNNEKVKSINTEGVGLSVEHYVNEPLLQPHEAFGKYALALIPPEATHQESISAIQEAGRRFNAIAPDNRKITLLYHFTNTEGANTISEQAIIGRPGDTRVYLTEITPDVAQPLASAEDARNFETYFKEQRIPQTLQEHMKRFVLAMKFKWRHNIQKKLLSKPIVPVGADKLENVIVLAAQSNSPILKRDDQGELYVENPIKVQSDPNFHVFGPFQTPETKMENR